MRSGLSRRRLAILAVLLLVLAGYRTVFSASDLMPVYIIFTEEAGFSEASKTEILTLLRLDARDRHVKVMREADAEIVTDLDRIRQRIDTVGDNVDNGLLFVPLSAPTADSKKLLRASLEEAYGGTGCRLAEALRQTVPVVSAELYSPDAVISAHDACTQACPEPRVSEPVHDQIHDDVVYFDDNFRGMGLLVRSVDRDVFARFGDALDDLAPRMAETACEA